MKLGRGGDRGLYAAHCLSMRRAGGLGAEGAGEEGARFGRAGGTLDDRAPACEEGDGVLVKLQSYEEWIGRYGTLSRQLLG